MLALPFVALEAQCPSCGVWRAQIAAPPTHTHCRHCKAWLDVVAIGRALRAMAWTLVAARGAGGQVSQWRTAPDQLATARARGLITYAEGARILGVTYSSVTTLVKRYSMVKTPVGKNVLISRAELERVWANRRQRPTGVA